MLYIVSIDGPATRAAKSTTNAFEYDGRATGKSDASTESNERTSDVATATAATRGGRQCSSTWAESTKPKSNDGMHSMFFAEFAVESLSILIFVFILTKQNMNAGNQQPQQQMMNDGSQQMGQQQQPQQVIPGGSQPRSQQVGSNVSKK